MEIKHFYWLKALFEKYGADTLINIIKEIQEGKERKDII